MSSWEGHRETSWVDFGAYIEGTLGPMEFGLRSREVRRTADTSKGRAQLYSPRKVRPDLTLKIETKISGLMEVHKVLEGHTWRERQHSKRCSPQLASRPNVDYDSCLSCTFADNRIAVVWSKGTLLCLCPRHLDPTQGLDATTCT